MEEDEPNYLNHAEAKRKNAVPRLAWDIEKMRLEFEGIYISVIHPELPPSHINAFVEEQDTSLALSEFTEFHDPGELPVWYLGHKAASEPGRKTGSVVIHDYNPYVFQAIIHDLDEDPTWHVEWITEALDSIYSLTLDKGITSLRIPALGHVHGRMPLEDSIKLIMNRLKLFINDNQIKSNRLSLQKILILVDKDEYLKAFSILKELI